MERYERIFNGNLSATINYFGAELISLKKGEKEIIWNGDERFWKNHAPILFPVCGGLKDDTYYLNGKKYHMPKHGFAKLVEFELFEKKENSVSFILNDSPETLKGFPFAFSFIVSYTLTDCLSVEYKVINKDKVAMYFSIGCHEAYTLPDDFTNYYVKFEKREELKALNVVGTSVSEEYVDYGTSDTLNLNYDLFAIDAVVLRHINSRKITLAHKTKGEVCTVCADDNFKNLLLWTKPGAPFLCIEPWTALPDFIDTNQQIEEKPDICALPSGETKIFKHKILI